MNNAMQGKLDWSSLKHRWWVFITVVADPWAWVLFVVTVALGITATIAKSQNTTLFALLTLLVGLLSGVVGGILRNNWTEVTGQRVLVARGKTAVRSLRLLLNNLGALDRRLRTYIECHKRQPAQPEMTAIYLNESLARCVGLEDEALSSIANWTDIVPEADLATEIGVISQLQEQVERRTTELQALDAQFTDTKDKSQAEAAALRKQIGEKEAELRKARSELAEQRVRAGSFLSPVSLGNSVFLTSGENVARDLSWTLRKTCRKCGKEYDDSNVIDVSGLCPACRTEEMGGIAVRPP